MKKMKATRCKSHIFFLLAVAMVCLLTSRPIYASDKKISRIHFISLNNYTDAILLESNGHYGMVDSGEDWDYPPNTEKYPIRSGVTMDVGFEQQVINYLDQLGVEKLDFYIATHSHSDHIGSGDEILRHFPTDILYIQEYKDENLLDAHGVNLEDPYYNPNAKENRLWDNQYVYDRLIQAAQETETKIIKNLDEEANAPYRRFEMGDMDIEIMNYERERDENGDIIPISSENCNSLVTKVTVNEQVALLTADLDPSDGDSIKIASQLIAQLSDSEDEEGNISGIIETEIAETSDSDVPTDVVLDLPENYSDNVQNIMRGYAQKQAEIWSKELSQVIDESKPNTGKTISIDLMKLAHHGMDSNNTTYFLTSLKPQNVVITGPIGRYIKRYEDCLPDTVAFATNTDSAAVVATFTNPGEDMDIEYTSIPSRWLEIDGKQYFFDKFGRTSSGVCKINGKLYCFTEQGAARSGWIQIGENWYYADPDTYEMNVGWSVINGKEYYFDSSGVLQIYKVIDGYYVGGDGAKVTNYAGGWIFDNGRWWYRYSDGSYPYSGWKWINGAWYYFDAAGWLVTGGG